MTHHTFSSCAVPEIGAIAHASFTMRPITRMSNLRRVGPLGPGALIFALLLIAAQTGICAGAVSSNATNSGSNNSSGQPIQDSITKPEHQSRFEPCFNRTAFEYWSCAVEIVDQSTQDLVSVVDHPTFTLDGETRGVCVCVCVMCVCVWVGVFLSLPPSHSLCVCVRVMGVRCGGCGPEHTGFGVCGGSPDLHTQRGDARCVCVSFSLSLSLSLSLSRVQRSRSKRLESMEIISKT